MIVQTDSINIIKMKDLLKLSNKALVAFINPITKKIWITYTNSIVTSLERNTTLLAQGMHSIKALNADKDDLEVVILEQHSSMRYLKYKIKSYYDSYINNGYSLYKEELLSIGWKFQYKIYNNSERKVKLYLVGNCRNNKILIGEFENIAKCKEFMDNGIEHCLKLISD